MCAHMISLEYSVFSCFPTRFVISLGYGMVHRGKFDFYLEIGSGVRYEYSALGSTIVRTLSMYQHTLPHSVGQGAGLPFPLQS